MVINQWAAEHHRLSVKAFKSWMDDVGGFFKDTGTEARKDEVGEMR